MSESYVSLKKSAAVESIVKKSRFIAYAQPCGSVEEANAFLASLRKKYYDSTHVCYAFSIGDLVRSSDDGEPSGTAGAPILGVITVNGLRNCLVAVVRYFGGILLGAGGLVRAYSSSAAEAVQNAGLVVYEEAIRLFAAADYTVYNDVRRLFSDDERVIFSDEEFSESVRFAIKFKACDENDVLQRLTDITRGNIKFISTEKTLLPFDK